MQGIRSPGWKTSRTKLAENWKGELFSPLGADERHCLNRQVTPRCRFYPFGRLGSTGVDASNLCATLESSWCCRSQASRRKSRQSDHTSIHLLSSRTILHNDWIRLGFNAYSARSTGMGSRELPAKAVFSAPSEDGSCVCLTPDVQGFTSAAFQVHRSCRSICNCRSKQNRIRNP